MNKPCSPACERNRDVILEVLRPRLAQRRHVLEIGSGTGQHAVHFAAALPQIVWQSSDVAANLPGIRLWLDEAALPNTLAPLELDVNHALPPALLTMRFDAIFTANTLHIMGWDEVRRLFDLLPGLMAANALLLVYGPFNYQGHFTSDSNAQFDVSLRSTDPQRGIRDFEAVEALARAGGLTLLEDLAMPANNRCLIWKYSRT